MIRRVWFDAPALRGGDGFDAPALRGGDGFDAPALRGGDGFDAPALRGGDGFDAPALRGGDGFDAPALRGGDGLRFAFALWIGLAWGCGEDRVQPAAVSTTRTSSPPVAAGATPGAEQDLRLIDGDAVLDPLRDGKLRGLVVNVWASWCGSCKEEIPILLGLRKSFAAEGIGFAFVSADEPRAFPQAISLMRSWHGPIPLLALGGASIKSFKRAMHPEWKGAIPATFLFDGTRKLRHFWEGPIVEQEITPILQGLLAGEAIDGVTRTAATPRETNR